MVDVNDKRRLGGRKALVTLFDELRTQRNSKAYTNDAWVVFGFARVIIFDLDPAVMVANALPLIPEQSEKWEKFAS